MPRSDNDPMRIRAGLASTAGTLPPRDDVDVDLGCVGAMGARCTLTSTLAASTDTTASRCY